MTHKNVDINLIRHTLAHLLADVVLKLYPGTKNTIGPAIADGFYYDFEFPAGIKISDKDLTSFEKHMKKTLPSWKEFTHKEVTASEAKEIFKDNQYKIELIDEILAKGEKITLYTCGNFTDLCRGGHCEHPSVDIHPDSFKLSRIAGAYWRGNENNTMLTRIYGLSFESKQSLDEYETQRVEAEKRDHKKIGKEHKIFTISPLVGAGLPLMQPKGMIIREEISSYLWELHKRKGYFKVWTPHIAKEELYKTSGHAEKFGDELFRVTGGDEKFILKPMNCPHHMQIFADNQFSYRDMPVRYFEPATVYRDEKSGQLAGLARVRSITQDDGHLFCSQAQIGDEVGTIVHIIKTFYTTIGLMDNYWVRLSVRGDDKSQYLGSDEVWMKAEQALENSAKENSLPYKIGKGEAAFYGPKLDFMFKDSIGREWQLATIQCDFNLPERFDLSFTNEKGEKERPVVIHRAISGSLERFLAILIEHFAGKFPVWLAPTQVSIIPIGDAHHEKALELHERMRDMGIRSSVNLSKDGFGKKVREAKTELIPYFVIIGDKDIAVDKVTLESRDRGQIGQISANEVIEKIQEEIRTRSL